MIQEDTMTITMRPTKATEQPVLHTEALNGPVTVDPTPHEVYVGTAAVEAPAHNRAYGFALAATRISLGWIFLWAFIDKLFGLGHETPSSGAWINGGSPTAGFLGHATKGPFASIYQNIAGAAWADWLFMAGLAGIGAALMLGVAMRFAAAAGATLLVLMWSAALPPDNNLFMDDHIIYALVLVVLALAGADKTIGLGRMWERLPLVKRYGLLK
jgi:thiosulfate dehydrogenase [quinone] large subunit